MRPVDMRLYSPLIPFAKQLGTPLFVPKLDGVVVAEPAPTSRDFLLGSSYGGTYMPCFPGQVFLWSVDMKTSADWNGNVSASKIRFGAIGTNALIGTLAAVSTPVTEWTTYINGVRIPPGVTAYRAVIQGNHTTGQQFWRNLRLLRA